MDFRSVSPNAGFGLVGASYRTSEGVSHGFADVCAEKVEDDGLSFLSDTIRIEKIREEEAYQGIRVLLEARLANARIPLQIDVGFGDVITPAPVEVEYPTLLAFPAAKMRAYPRESVVAEKFEAMIKLGMANSRMKDFYDLWVMAGRFEFRGPVLGEALAATFARRKTGLPASRPLALTPEFSASPAKQTQWRAFLRKSGLEAGASLQDVTNAIDAFLIPVVEGILRKGTIPSLWRPGGPWRASPPD